MGRYLDMINSPADVKLLTLEQLQTLAQEIRDELIKVLSKNGGHVGPNLGVVELTIALHRVFDCPKDKFVWDVSHQIYVHKLLTGRRRSFRKCARRAACWGSRFARKAPMTASARGTRARRCPQRWAWRPARDKAGGRARGLRSSAMRR